MESIGVGRVLREHTGRITSLDFTKDGELLLSAAEDDRLCVYSCQSGTLQRVVQSPRYGVSIARFTHDPLTVIGASRGTPASGDPSVADLGTHAIRYHSLHDNSYLRFFRGHTAPVLSLELSPKQDIFASAAADDTLRTWDVLAASLCGGLIKLYDVRSCTQGPFTTFAPPVGEPKDFASLSFSGDGKLLLVGTAQGVVLNLDGFTGALLQKYSGHANDAGVPLEACFSADGEQVMCGSEDGTVWRWRTGDGTPLGPPLTGHSGPVRSVKCNPTRQLAASACEHVCLWLPKNR